MERTLAALPDPRPNSNYRSSFRGQLDRSVILPILLLVCFVAFLIYEIEQLRVTSEWVDHTDQVIETAYHANKLIIDAETGLRGYLLEKEPVFLEPYQQATTTLGGLFDDLEKLVSDNPPQVARTESIRQAYQDWLSSVQRLIDQPESRSLAESVLLKAKMDAIRKSFDQFLGVEYGLRTERNHRTERAVKSVFATATSLAAALAAFVFFYVRKRLAKLAKIYENALNQLQLAQQDLRKTNASLEIKVRDRTRELEIANHELEAFTYSAAHDLRAPLRSIDGFSKMLSVVTSGLADDKIQHYVSRIRAGAGRMGHMIDDLLSLSRVSKSALNRLDVDLSALAHEILAELRAASPERNVRVEVESPARAHCDPDLVRLLLTNLLTNAWKYSSKAAEANVQFACVSGSSPRVFFVSDNGVGFDMKYADRLFRPFERLHTSEDFEGNGIGLAISKSVVDRHGGRIWAEAQAGAGASFFFTLMPDSLAHAQEVR